MRAALATPHPLSSFSLTHEAADLLQAVSHVSGFHGDPVGLSAERHVMQSVLARASMAARPLSARLHDFMSPSVRQVAGGLNLALLAASIGFPDSSIAENFVLGCPVCGFVPVSDSVYCDCARVRGFVVTVKPQQRRISDSPRRSGDCPTATWCGASLTVLKHPHCGHSHASVVKYP